MVRAKELIFLPETEAYSSFIFRRTCLKGSSAKYTDFLPTYEKMIAEANSDN